MGWMEATSLSMMMGSGSEWRSHQRGSGEVPSADAFITRVWVSKNTFDVVQVEYFIEDEEVAMTVECSDFRVVKQDSERTTSSIRLPFHIRAEDFRSSGGSMTLIFQEMVANADSSLFIFKP